MAKPNDTSKSRPRGNRSSKAQAASSPPKPVKAAPSVESLEDVVEDERARLMKAHSILSCVITAMEDENVCTGDGPYWPAVIETACDLINESIRRLEDLDYSPKPASRKGYEVREPAPDFGYGSWAGNSSLSTRDGDDAPEYGASDNRRPVAGQTAGNADIAGALEPLLKTH